MPCIKIRLIGRVSSLSKRDSWRILDIELDRVRRFYFGTTGRVGIGRWWGNFLIFSTVLWIRRPGPMLFVEIWRVEGMKPNFEEKP